MNLSRKRLAGYSMGVAVGGVIALSEFFFSSYIGAIVALLAFGLVAAGMYIDLRTDIEFPDW